METKFTPGPWAVNWAGIGRNGKYVYDEVFVYAPASGVEDVAVAADIVDPVTSKPSIANARLIAAAPELLEALRWYVENDDTNIGMDGNEFWEQGLRRAEAVIAKATGDINGT